VAFHEAGPSGPLGMVDDELQHRGNLQRQLHGLARRSRCRPVTHGALMLLRVLLDSPSCISSLMASCALGQERLRHILCCRRLASKVTGAGKGEGLRESMALFSRLCMPAKCRCHRQKQAQHCGPSSLLTRRIHALSAAHRVEPAGIATSMQRRHVCLHASGAKRQIRMQPNLLSLELKRTP
jgi:hypothetical protein